MYIETLSSYASHKSQTMNVENKNLKSLHIHLLCLVHNKDKDSSILDSTTNKPCSSF